VEALTLAEFIAPRLVGIGRLVEVRSGAPGVSATLDMPAAITVDVLDRTQLEPDSLGEGQLLVCSLEADDAGLVDPELAEQCLAALRPGGCFLLVLRGERTVAIDGRLIETLADMGVPLLDVALVAGERSGAILAGCRGPGESGAADRRGWSRVEADARRGAEIRHLRQMIEEADGRLAAVQESRSFRIGRAVVDVARQRHRLLRRLPDGLRAWRRGRPHPADRSAAGQARTAALGAWHQAARFDPERLQLAYSDGSRGPRTRPVVAALVRDETAATLGPYATIHRLFPNTAAMTLERVDPDLVLVESGAFAAAGAWAYTAGANALDRDRTLLEILALAHELGRPSVLWKTAAVPQPIGLGPIEGRFDLVTTEPRSGSDPRGWTPGVPLSEFNAFGLDPGRSKAPLYLGDWDPRASRADQDLLRKVLTAGARHGLEILVDARSVAGSEAFPDDLRGSIRGVVEPASAAERYRSHRVVLANPAGRPDGLRRALAALACGARIVAPANPDFESAAGSAATIIGPADDADSAIEEAVGRDALGEPALRLIGRRLFQGYATPVALADLTERLGLRLDPLGQRSISILLRATTHDRLRSSLDAIATQVQAPREIVAVAPPDSSKAEAQRELARSGILVRLVDPALDPRTWRDLASAASQPWLIAWPEGPVEPNLLLDLASAAESSGADAVGQISGPASQFVLDLPFGGTLIRREGLTTGFIGGAWDRDPNLAGWARRGGRLFGLPAASGSLEP
jgi:hypothetical protein